MTLKDWINNKFGERGIAKAARFLGYPYKTVIAWANLERFPRPAAQEIITLKSGGAVNINHWRAVFLNAEHERKATL